MTYEQVLEQLQSLADPQAVAGMARFGITPAQTYGASLPQLRSLARRIGRDHDLALHLWEADVRETRILATIVADPKLVTEDLMEQWAKDFDYWEICDQCCMNLFERIELAYAKALEWSARNEEFVKRAGFVLMARLAVSDKKAADSRFEAFFPPILREAGDERNYVKKAVNWALRQIGKRNLALCSQAIAVAEQMRSMDSPSARWIATDALRELTSEAVQARLRRDSMEVSKCVSLT